MDIETIRRELSPGLNEMFMHKIDYVNNVSEPILFIFNHSPGNDEPVASFALSMINYEQNSFPSKCWMNHEKVGPVSGVLPKLHDEYKRFSFNGYIFHPFSVGLSEYKPKDLSSIKSLVNRLYQHIIFGDSS